MLASRSFNRKVLESLHQSDVSSSFTPFGVNLHVFLQYMMGGPDHYLE